MSEKSTAGGDSTAAQSGVPAGPGVSPATGRVSDEARIGAEAQPRVAACPEDVIASVADELSGCADDALSQAACRGIVDPEEVIQWLDRTERLVRFKYDKVEIQSELQWIADGLQGLLQKIDLPANGSAEVATERFIRSLPSIRAMVSEDVVAAFEGDPAAEGAAEIVVAYPAIRALSIHRISHIFYNMGVPLLPRVMSEYAHDRTGIDIHPGAQIGERFFIDHGTGVVIGETCVIGSSVRLYQGVTLGSKSLRDSSSLRGVKRHPTVEDDVTIYAGATILGGETVIGAGSVIGGNVWLTRSVPPGTRVLAEPPRQLVHEGEQDDDASVQLTWDI